MSIVPACRTDSATPMSGDAGDRAEAPGAENSRRRQRHFLGSANASHGRGGVPWGPGFFDETGRSERFAAVAYPLEGMARRSHVPAVRGEGLTPRTDGEAGRRGPDRRHMSAATSTDGYGSNLGKAVGAAGTRVLVVDDEPWVRDIIARWATRRAPDLRRRCRRRRSDRAAAPAALLTAGLGHDDAGALRARPAVARPQALPRPGRCHGHRGQRPPDRRRDAAARRLRLRHQTSRPERGVDQRRQRARAPSPHQAERLLRTRAGGRGQGAYRRDPSA